MQSIARIKASNGTSNASVATVQNLRLPLATTIVVDTVEGIPTNFYASMGTAHNFVDPITAEEITVISEATAVDFAGHVDGSNLIIDTIAPGYTDAGSAVNDVVIIRPTTQWADNVAGVFLQSHNDDGTLKSNLVTNGMMATAVKPETLMAETSFDFIASGCIWTADAVGSTRAASMSSGVVYIAGKRLTVAAVTSRTFTASKDVYVGLKDNGDGTAAIVYYDNTTNAASPSLGTAGYTVVLAIIVVGASSIAATGSINQGQEDRVLPIASSIPYTVTDSLGNLICPRDSKRRLLGYRAFPAQDIVSTTFVDIVPTLCPIVPPTGRKVKITLFCEQPSFASVSFGGTVQIYDVTGSTTVRSGGTSTNVNADDNSLTVSALVTPATTPRSYKVQGKVNRAGTFNTGAGYVMVELV